MNDEHQTDHLSAELHAFLIQLGRDPHTVSHQMSHYIEHLLHLLPIDDEETLHRFYGLFGHEACPLQALAQEQGVDMNTLAAQVAARLRRIAVTPEWQMLREVIHHDSTNHTYHTLE